MKLYYSFLIQFILPSIALCQPVLDSANSSPVIGDSYALAIANHVSQGGSGSNQIWNFSVLTGTSFSSPFHVLDVDSTPHAAEFQNSSFSLSQFDPYYAYMFSSSEVLQFTGSNYDNLTYYDPIDELRFPFGYGDSYVDSSLAIGINQSLDSIYRIGTHSVSADAYGTLIMPHYSVSTLRIKTYNVFKDSVFQGPNAGTVTTKTYTTYAWRAAGAHYYLALVNSTYPTSSFEFLDALPVGIKKATNIGGLSIFPNPVDDQLNVHLENESVNAISFLKDVHGMNIRTFALKGKTTILDFDGISKGVYFLEIYSGSERRIEKVIKMND